MSEMITIRCRKPPVVNRKQGVYLGYEGATTEIESSDFNVSGSGFWQGQIERGAIEVVEVEEMAEIEVETESVPAVEIEQIKAEIEPEIDIKVEPEPDVVDPVEPDITKPVEPDVIKIETRRCVHVYPNKLQCKYEAVDGSDYCQKCIEKGRGE